MVDDGRRVSSTPRAGTLQYDERPQLGLSASWLRVESTMCRIQARSVVSYPYVLGGRQGRNAAHTSLFLAAA
jgi:hypothetical protein